MISFRDETQLQDCSYCSTSCFSLRNHVKLHHATQSIRCFQYISESPILKRPLFVKDTSTRIFKTRTLSFKWRLCTCTMESLFMYGVIDLDAARETWWVNLLYCRSDVMPANDRSFHQSMYFQKTAILIILSQDHHRDHYNYSALVPLFLSLHLFSLVLLSSPQRQPISSPQAFHQESIKVLRNILSSVILNFHHALRPDCLRRLINIFLRCPKNASLKVQSSGSSAGFSLLTLFRFLPLLTHLSHCIAYRTLTF